MRFEAFSHPKARDLSVPPDDVLLHIPGRLIAVFDGASDPSPTPPGRMSRGRAAALAAAGALSRLPDDAASWPAADILNRLSEAVGKSGEGSTTAMIAFLGDDRIRLVGVGDTGFRINAGAPQIAEVTPDRATIPARVALFRGFLDAGRDPAECEALARQCLADGLDAAAATGAVSAAAAEAAIAHAIESADLPGAEAEIAALLRGGLHTQQAHANRADSPLGYAVLDGAPPPTDLATDMHLEPREVTSLEIFSDGYLSVPDSPTIAAWETEYAEVEARDPHKIGAHRAVKGSTATQFFDDRTVVILTTGTGPYTM